MNRRGFDCLWTETVLLILDQLYALTSMGRRPPGWVPIPGTENEVLLSPGSTCKNTETTEASVTA